MAFELCPQCNTYGIDSRAADLIRACDTARPIISQDAAWELYEAEQNYQENGTEPFAVLHALARVEKEIEEGGR